MKLDPTINWTYGSHTLDFWYKGVVAGIPIWLPSKWVNAFLGKILSLDITGRSFLD